MRLLLVSLLSAYAAAQTACPPFEFVYAPQNAGTGAQFESAASKVWSKGYGAAGYSLYTNLTALIPGMAGYPVHYPASFSGCTSEDPGIKDMQNHLIARAKQCPDIKFSLGGHSQGGFVTARTLPRLPKEVNKKIIAVTMFGSPRCIDKLGVAGRCKSYCYKNDEVTNENR
ncbi:alpha/beta-hydrolase [Tothia fuscella]|uniref:Alpha/beta-hydrolase n=1 Tax=Tothia fuscella TaxID=1048955 RepID=A0A9P4NMV3_9PEZI|nr:alpha/beta-hydrolase [Tothia fuscella]